MAPFVKRNHKEVKEEWIDNNSLSLIKEEIGCHKRYSIDDNTHTKFKEAHNLARQSINNARADTINSPRKFWYDLKNLMPGKKGIIKNSTSRISLANNDGFLFDIEQNLVNFANSYMINVGLDLAAKIPI